MNLSKWCGTNFRIQNSKIQIQSINNKNVKVQRFKFKAPIEISKFPIDESNIQKEGGGRGGRMRFLFTTHWLLFTIDASLQCKLKLKSQAKKVAIWSIVPFAGAKVPPICERINHSTNEAYRQNEWVIRNIVSIFWCIADAFGCDLSHRQAKVAHIVGYMFDGNSQWVS